MPAHFREERCHIGPQFLGLNVVPVKEALADSCFGQPLVDEVPDLCAEWIKTVVHASIHVQEYRFSVKLSKYDTLAHHHWLIHYYVHSCLQVTAIRASKRGLHLGPG